MTLMKHIWSHIRLGLFGPADVPYAQQQVALIFIAFFFLSLANLFNLVFEVTARPMLVILALCQVWIAMTWWLARFRRQVKLATGLLLGNLIVVILPTTWFYNGGVNGPSLILYLAMLTYGAGMAQSRRWVRLTIFLALLVLPMTLLWVEYQYPDWIFQYPSQEYRLMDVAISYVLCAIVIALIVRGHVSRFQAELGKANHLAEKLTELARRDSLTNLLNHGAIHEEAAQQLAGEGGGTLVMLDIDHFKRINDEEGHLYGDQVLRQLANVLQEAGARHNCSVGRFGGEEFMLVSAAHMETTLAMVKELRVQTEALDLPHGTLQFSAGVVELESNKTLHQAIQSADAALYEAKAAGRNQTCRGRKVEPWLAMSDSVV